MDKRLTDPSAAGEVTLPFDHGSRRLKWPADFSSLRRESGNFDNLAAQAKSLGERDVLGASSLRRRHDDPDDRNWTSIRLSSAQAPTKQPGAWAASNEAGRDRPTTQRGPPRRT